MNKLKHIALLTLGFSFLCLKVSANDIQKSGAPGWLVLPFLSLLFLIASGPVLYAHFWHKYFKPIAVGLGLFVAGYYVVILGDSHSPIHAFFEYFSFVSLLIPLFIASGGIHIEISRPGNAKVNLIILLVGAILSNLIGTTGASMLLIRPMIRMNKDRMQPYLIVFFIFFVSNLGGALTPIGDPPLFLGFLKGVPFFWMIQHSIAPWIVSMILLSLVFWVLDNKNNSFNIDKSKFYTGNITIKGKQNFIILFLIILTVFIDPNIFPEVPALTIDGNRFSIIREILQLILAAVSYFSTKKSIHKSNDFNFDPIAEVAFLFIGIFMTMIPALQWVEKVAATPEGMNSLTTNTLYWATGICSSFLDNAPTYVNFLAAAMTKFGLNSGIPVDVKTFASGVLHQESIQYLSAISFAAVAFGAMTYIGNGPNFMVKAIAEQNGVKMPDFLSYIIKYSLKYLFPVLLITWILLYLF